VCCFDKDIAVQITKSFRWIAGVLVLFAPLCGSQTRTAGKKNTLQTAPPASPSELIWPIPPDPPRVRWLAEYTDMAKVKNPAAQKRSWLEKVAGTKTPDEKLALRKPYGVATDSRGRIYAADSALGIVIVIDPEAKEVERRQGNGRAPMAMPVGVAVDSEDRLFVSDAQLHSITCFKPTGEVIARFGTASLGRPGGISIDRRRNRLYVADAKESRIAVFDTKTFQLAGFFGAPSKPGNPEKGTFSGPTNVAVDRQGNIYVADTFNCRVQIISPAGKFLNAFGTQGDRPGEFIRPKGIAVDSEGHVYVADAEFNNFQVLSPEGQPLLAVGVLGSAPGEFGLIAGLYIDSEDRIYTTEMYVGRIQVFQYIAQPASAVRKEVGKIGNH
jgi:DNA-binding beta-propeller fold protein YncE